MAWLVVLFALCRASAAAASPGHEAVAQAKAAPGPASASAATLTTGLPQRQHLTTTQLREGFTYTEPLPLAAFAPMPGASGARHRFEGVLMLDDTARSGSFREYTDRYDVVGVGDAPVKHLPEFAFELIQVGDALVPVRRGAIPGDHPYWEWILEPGRVWQETQDGKYSRAALPFSLEEVNENCVHNGVLTFLYRADGAVSRVAYQVSSETCAYFKADLWGVLTARFTPRRIEAGDAIGHAYRAEVAARLPRKPIAALGEDFPGVNPANFGHPAEVTAEHMTTWGVVADGVHYSGGCPTRAGSYPFCEVLDLPSYSIAKSVFAGLALMRLEQLQPGTRALRVGDYVPECAANLDWRDVSFENLLDMASGFYLSPGSYVDETAPHIIERFFLPTSHREKIDYACNFFARREKPGGRWVYRTADTYLLGTALNAYLKRERGRDADLFDDVIVRGIWQPLALSPVTTISRRTRDETAQPFAGFGLVLQPDDVAKLGQFLNPTSGAADHLLDPAMRRAALQLDANDRGLPAGVDGATLYNNGFWALPFADVAGCPGPLHVPYMSGFGGITVLLLPNGVTYYYFSDNDEYRFRRALDEAARIRSYCPPHHSSNKKATSP
jgi:Beta-lactamase